MRSTVVTTNGDSNNADTDNDNDKVAGGAEVVELAGIGGWSADETKQLCRRVNNLALPTLMDTMDGLEAAVASLDADPY